VNRSIDAGTAPLGRYAPTLAAVLIWSSSFICTKIAYASFSPLFLGALRFVLATVALDIYTRARGIRVSPPAEDRRRIAVSGLLGITAYFSFENLGLRLTTASNASLIVASYPVISILVAKIAEGRRIEPPRLIGALIAIAGVALVVVKTDEGSAKGAWIGNLLLILAGFVWTAYTMTTRKLVGSYPAATISLIQTRVGALAFVPIALVEGAPRAIPALAPLAALLYLSLLCSVLAFMLYNAGLKRLPASASISLMNIVPVVGVALSALVLHETITWRQVIGGAVIIAGVGMSARQGRQAAGRIIE
jgi:drug/metabolite transporter (DMT)-like permease